MPGLKWIVAIVFSKSSGNLVYRRTDRRTDKHRGESSIPPLHLRWSRGINIQLDASQEFSRCLRTTALGLPENFQMIGAFSHSMTQFRKVQTLRELFVLTNTNLIHKTGGGVSPKRKQKHWLKVGSISIGRPSFPSISILGYAIWLTYLSNSRFNMADEYGLTLNWSQEICSQLKRPARVLHQDKKAILYIADRNPNT